MLHVTSNHRKLFSDRYLSTWRTILLFRLEILQNVWRFWPSKPCCTCLYFGRHCFSKTIQQNYIRSWKFDHKFPIINFSKKLFSFACCHMWTVESSNFQYQRWDSTVIHIWIVATFLQSLRFRCSKHCIQRTSKSRIKYADESWLKMCKHCSRLLAPRHTNHSNLK